jgi:hypothetical protein
MSQIIDCIFVSTEPFTEPGRCDLSPEECFRFCLGVNLYATRLSLFGFRDDEMPRSLIHVHRVTELVLQTEPCDDIVDFLVEIKWSQVRVEETIKALEQIGADAHARFLTALHHCLKSFEYKVKREDLDQIYEVIAKAAEDYLSAEILETHYGDFGVNGDDDLDRRWRSICLQAVRYMDSWTNIKRVPNGAHNDAELQRYFDSRPAIVERLKEIEKDNSRPAQTSKWW